MNNVKKTSQPYQLTITNQWLISILLLAILLVSRYAYIEQFQDATWAVFFLVGFYLRRYIGLPIVMLSVITLDFVMIAIQGGHQDYYLAPSYLFIIPAYSALWFAGRTLANNYSEDLNGLLKFYLAAVLGIVVCDLISSGGFYWMSSSSMEVSWDEFIARTMDFMPISLRVNLSFLSIAAVVHIAFVLLAKFDTREKQST